MVAFIYLYLLYNKKAFMVTIVEAITKKQKKAFATFPISLYKDNKCFVPSLVEDEMALDNPKKNLYKANANAT